MTILLASTHTMKFRDTMYGMKQTMYGLFGRKGTRLGGYYILTTAQVKFGLVHAFVIVKSLWSYIFQIFKNF